MKKIIIMCLLIMPITGCEQDPSVFVNNQTLVSVYNSPLKPVINQNSNQLVCSEINVDYQWLDSNFDSIPSANMQTFSPTSSGDFYVMISNSNCSEISDVYSFALTSVNENCINNFVFDYSSFSFKSD